MKLKLLLHPSGFAPNDHSVLIERGFKFKNRFGYFVLPKGQYSIRVTFEKSSKSFPNKYIIYKVWCGGLDKRFAAALDSIPRLIEYLDNELIKK